MPLILGSIILLTEGNLKFMEHLQNVSHLTAPFLRVKRPGREADHPPLSSAEIKECVALYLHSPTRLHGVMLSLKEKQRDKFRFYLC
jgi:hypothetical protein